MINKIIFLILILGITSIGTANAQPVNLNTLAPLSTENKQTLTEFFEQCAAGMILYKLNGEFYVYCLITPVSGILYGYNGEQIEVNIDVDTSVSNNDGDGKDQSSSDDTGPDKQCLFDPSLPKCAPDKNDECPEDFNMNEDGQCFPEHDECPNGYHSEDDDESGKCINDDEGCPDGMEMVGKNCTYIQEEEDSVTTEEEENDTNNEEEQDQQESDQPEQQEEDSSTEQQEDESISEEEPQQEEGSDENNN